MNKKILAGSLAGLAIGGAAVKGCEKIADAVIGGVGSDESEKKEESVIEPPHDESSWYDRVRNALKSEEEKAKTLTP